MATTFAQRVSMVLEKSNLNQTDFSARIPISQQYLSQICSGKKDPSDRVIKNICKEFNVSEDWLRYEKGRMEADISRENEIAALMRSSLHGSEEFKEAVIQAVKTRSVSELEMLEKMLWDIVYNLQKNKKGQDES